MGVQGAAAWLPYAQQVAAATGVLPGVLLALGQEETGLGTAGTGLQNNIWGVRYAPGASAAGTTQQAGGFAAYPTPAIAAADMIRVLQLPYYAAVRSAQGAPAQIEALAASPYNGASLAQREVWAQTLISVYQSGGFAQYDGGGAGTSVPMPAGFSASGSGNTLTITAPAGTDLGGGAGAVGALLVVGAVGAVLAWAAAHL